MSLVITRSLSFNLHAGETLLEGLERTGHTIEYQCRSGYCGSCRTRIISGDVEYLTDPLAYISNGEVLPCCCVPVGNAVTLDVDTERADSQSSSLEYVQEGLL